MADEEMIQRHADNFLAAIAGETPVDDNVRNSKEFWLKKIAEKTSGLKEVVANPTMAGTEADLEGLQVGDTKYKVGGTEVVANPTMAGTEGDLTGLQVGDTKYKVGVNELYLHNISIKKSGDHTGCVFFKIFNNNSTPFTILTLYDYLTENGHIISNGVEHAVMASGYYKSVYDEESHSIFGVIRTDSVVHTQIDLYVVSGTSYSRGDFSSIQASDFNDIVTKLS